MATKLEKQQALDSAIDYVKRYAPEGSRIRGTVTHVSRSGMSRRIEFYAGYTETDGTTSTVWLTGAFATITGWPMNDRGLKVDGCGMDMVFHTIYNVAYAVYGDGYALKQN